MAFLINVFHIRARTYHAIGILTMNQSKSVSKFVLWEGTGYKPIGYGPDSVSASVTTAVRIENEVQGLSAEDSLKKRQQIIR